MKYFVLPHSFISFSWFHWNLFYMGNGGHFVQIWFLVLELNKLKTSSLCEISFLKCYVIYAFASLCSLCLSSFSSIHTENLKSDNPIKSSSIVNIIMKSSHILVTENYLSLLPKLFLQSSFMAYNLESSHGCDTMFLLKRVLHSWEVCILSSYLFIVLFFLTTPYCVYSPHSLYLLI